MLRTLPLSRDIKTVAIVRAAPVKEQLSLLAPSSSQQAPRPCNLFSARGANEVERPPATPWDDEEPTEPISPYRTGAIIAGKYRLLRQVGRGGMGEVWSAEHLALNTEVAIKFLSTDTTGHTATVALERFRFEAQVSAHLGLKTAHVVAVHDAGSDASGPYLVMEHVQGRTLRMELHKRGQLEPEMVASVIDQVAEALSVAHEFGIVHRDLKPSNLLLLEQPNASIYVKVADFGIAKALRADLAVDLPDETSDGWMLGSPAYMSPEQMGGGRIDPRTDMWALGVIAYESLTGRLPFPGRSVSEIFLNMSTGRFDPPSKIRPSLPSEIDDWCLRALASRPDERFGSMEEMARAFRRAITARSPRRLHRVARGLAMVGGLAAALVALQPRPSEALPEVGGAAAVEGQGAKQAASGEGGATSRSGAPSALASSTSSTSSAQQPPGAAVTSPASFGEAPLDGIEWCPSSAEAASRPAAPAPPRPTAAPSARRPSPAPRSPSPVPRAPAPSTKRRVLTEVF